MSTSIISSIASLFNGETFAEVVGIVRDRFPPDLSEKEEALIEQASKEAAREYNIRLERLAIQKDQEFNNRIKDLEGTAADLKSIPILGAVVIFLRGLQRPIWGFATLYLDFAWFVGGNDWTDQQSTAITVINIIVLSFLFGERAVKNIMPLVATMFINKSK